MASIYAIAIAVDVTVALCWSEMLWNSISGDAISLPSGDDVNDMFS